MSLYVQSKSYNKPSLPPLSSLLKDQNYKLPSIDTLHTHSPLPIPTGLYASTPLPVSEGVSGSASRSGSNLGSPNSSSTSPTSPNFSKKSSPEPVAGAKSKRKQDKAFAFISHSVATFPSQEPSIDNAPLARRKRRRTSPNELNILNQEFLLGSTPNKLRRIDIAKKVCMTEKAVQIWFQNKRQSVRKQSANDKEVTELPPTPEVSVNTSVNTSMSNSTANSMNNSMINLNVNTSMTSMNNTSVISSTPIKPTLMKAHSFASPEATSVSPIDSFNKPLLPHVLGPVRPASASTPNSSFVDDSVDSTPTSSFFLQETKKKQPVMLNNSNSSTMTFKLGKFKVHNDKENKEVPTKHNKIQNLLNNVAEERKPLGDVNTNLGTRKFKVNEGVQSLLSLRGGSWSN